MNPARSNEEHIELFLAMQHIADCVQCGNFSGALNHTTNLGNLIKRLGNAHQEAVLRRELASRPHVTVGECFDLLGITTQEQRHYCLRRVTDTLKRLGYVKTRLSSAERQGSGRWIYAIPANKPERTKRKPATPLQIKTYFIRAGDLIKIGRSTDVASRIKALQTANPHNIELLATLDGDVEADAHRRFCDERVNGEWFRIDAHHVAHFVYEMTMSRKGRAQEVSKVTLQCPSS